MLSMMAFCLILYNELQSYGHRRLIARIERLTFFEAAPLQRMVLSDILANNSYKR